MPILRRVIRPTSMSCGASCNGGAGSGCRAARWPPTRCFLHWSTWRRRRQHQARTSHYKQRGHPPPPWTLAPSGNRACPQVVVRRVLFRGRGGVFGGPGADGGEGFLQGSAEVGEGVLDVAGGGLLVDGAGEEAVGLHAAQGLGEH